MRPLLTGTAHHSRRPPSAFTSPHYRNQGFTLVEVVLALGVATFAMLPILALMPIGLQTLQDSSNETVTAGIAQQIRGELQQISFAVPATSLNQLNMANLCGTLDGVYIPAISAAPGWTYYYTFDGIKINTDSAPLMTSMPSNAYYTAVFTRQTAVIPATTATGASMAYDTANAAEKVTVYIRYPAFAPQGNQKLTVFSMLAAKQNSD